VSQSISKSSKSRAASYLISILLNLKKLKTTSDLRAHRKKETLNRRVPVALILEQRNGAAQHIPGNIML